MEMLRSLRSKWNSRTESDELPSNSQQFKVPGPVPTPPPPPALMRGGLGSLRHSKPISRNPQPLSSSATTNNVHIRVASNTQGSSARGARRRIPTTETDIIATAPKAAAPQQHAPTTASASGESSSLIKNATNQTSDGQIKSKSPSKQAPLANPQAATAQTSETLLQDPALIEYCSGCFIDPMAVEKCPQLHARYQENEGLIRDFLDKLQMPNRRVAMDFALVSKTKQKNSAVATILFTCLDDDQKKQIESGLHKRNVIPPGFVARIIVWKFEYASRLISTPLNPGKYAGRRVEASFVEGRETMCGILGRLSSQGKSELEISAFTLGGTIIVDDAVFVLTTAHSLFQSTDTDIGRRRSSDDLEFRQIGDIYSYSFSGTVRSLISEDEDSNSSLDEVSWLGQDWALIRILNPEFRLPNRFYALPSSSPIFINGHLKNGELKAGKVSVLSVTGVVHGILNGSQTSMMMGQSYFTVRSIALERQLVEGDSGSWVVRDDKLCGYIFSRVVDSLWAYMLPIEPVFEDIRRTLRIGDPTSVGVFTSDTTQIHTQVPKIRIQAPGDPIALKSDIDVGSSHGKNANPNPESKPSGSKPQHESVNRSYQESRSKSGNIVLDNDTYDPSLPTCLSSEGHESNIRDPVQHYFGCLRENDKEPFFQSLSETLKRAVEVEKERIIRRRSLFENLDGTEQLVGMFRTSLVEFVYPRRDRLRPNMISPLVPAAEGGKMSLLNLDIRSDVVYFKDSNPYTDLSPRFEGEFPNQTISLADLLTSDEASPLTWDCGSNMVRYFHLPANNMSWVEEAISHYYDAKEKNSRRKERQPRNSAKSNLIKVLRSDVWRTLQLGPNNEYSRYLRPRCELLSPADVDRKPWNLCVFMPYLHWETNARRRRSLASSITSSAPTRNKGVEGRLLPTTYDIGVKPYGSKPNPSTLLEVAEGATEVRERLHLKRHTKPRTILGRVFLRAAALYEAMNCFSDQEILDKYLQMDPPLHPRRSLNQYRLWSSGKRDTDQVVYRETHSPARSRFYERGLDESKLLMVDQLWLWILDGNTIITSFPRRYGRNPDDPSSISRRIRSRLKNVREGEIKTAYDIALLVLDECSKTIFEPKRNPHDQKPELIDIFQNAIIRLGKRQQRSMNNFLHLTRTIDSQHGDGKSQEGGSMIKLLDSYSDMEIGQEIEDIASDLQIMVDIQHDQSSVIKDFVNSFERTGSRVPIKEGMISTKKPKKTRKSTLQGPTVGYNSESSSSDSRPSRPTMSDELGLEQTKKLALAVYNSSLEKGKWIVDLQESLSHVQLSWTENLSSRQDYTQLIQTREAMRQSKESDQQGRSILLATVMIVIFLPLIFISTIFGMNAKELNRGLLSIREEFTIMFPVTVGIVLISFALTFNSAVRLFVSTVSTLLWTWFPKNIGRALEKRTERNTRAMRRREVDEENKRWVALGPFSRTKEGSGGWAV